MNRNIVCSYILCRTNIFVREGGSTMKFRPNHNTISLEFRVGFVDVLPDRKATYSSETLWKEWRLWELPLRDLRFVIHQIVFLSMMSVSVFRGSCRYFLNIRVCTTAIPQIHYNKFRVSLIFLPPQHNVTLVCFTIPPSFLSLAGSHWLSLSVSIFCCSPSMFIPPCVSHKTGHEATAPPALAFDIGCVLWAWEWGHVPLPFTPRSPETPNQPTQRPPTAPPPFVIYCPVSCCTPCDALPFLFPTFPFQAAFVTLLLYVSLKTCVNNSQEQKQSCRKFQNKWNLFGGTEWKFALEVIGSFFPPSAHVFVRSSISFHILRLRPPSVCVHYVWSNMSSSLPASCMQSQRHITATHTQTFRLPVELMFPKRWPSSVNVAYP